MPSARPPKAPKKEASLLLERLNDTLLASIFSLADVVELGRLACTARRFSMITTKFSTVDVSAATRSVARAAFLDERWSLVEESARLRALAYLAAVRGLVWRREAESWLKVAAALVPLSTTLVLGTVRR
jgi:hypothetical protein